MKTQTLKVSSQLLDGWEAKISLQGFRAKSILLSEIRHFPAQGGNCGIDSEDGLGFSYTVPPTDIELFTYDTPCCQVCSFPAELGYSVLWVVFHEETPITLYLEPGMQILLDDPRRKTCMMRFFFFTGDLPSKTRLG